MPVPATVDELLEVVRKSAVLEPDRLQKYLKEQEAAGTLPDDPVRLARGLVRAGLLTRFQAEQCLMGKWRRFTIGNYRVLERLGSGGMGRVYLCEHQTLRHRVAIKILASTDAPDTLLVKRFEREGRAGAMLEHPNIVRAHDLGRQGNLHFLVMDYVYGASLQELVDKHGPLDMTRACHYIRQAARGLQYAHRQGLIHRDVKPANLLLDKCGTVKILDMGMARFSRDEEQLTNNLLGTADYLAPEQARDSHDVDHRADQYSLGATFYFLLAGRTPFHDAKTLGQKMMALQTQPPPPLRQARADVPEDLSRIIETMLAKEPAGRFANLDAVIDKLAPWTQTPIAPPSENELPRLSLALANDSTTDFEMSLKPVSEPAFTNPSLPKATVDGASARQVPLWQAVALTVLVTTLVLGALWWFVLRNHA